MFIQLDTCSHTSGVNSTSTGSHFNTAHELPPGQGVICDCHTFTALKTAVIPKSSSFFIFLHRVLIELITFLLLFFKSLTEVAASSLIQAIWVHHCDAYCGLEVRFPYFKACRFSKASSKVKETQEV